MHCDEHTGRGMLYRRIVLHSQSYISRYVHAHTTFTSSLPRARAGDEGANAREATGEKSEREGARRGY